MFTRRVTENITHTHEFLHTRIVLTSSSYTQHIHRRRKRNTPNSFDSSSQLNSPVAVLHLSQVVNGRLYIYCKTILEYNIENTKQPHSALHSGKLRGPGSRGLVKICHPGLSSWRVVVIRFYHDYVFFFYQFARCKRCEF